jgi:ribosomal protein L37AE/L43A
LERCEAVIARGVVTFVEVGHALTEIRDGKLYRAGYRTFDEYCQTRWGIGRGRAYQIIGASAITREMSTVVDNPPTNEREARELGKVEKEDRSKVLSRATEIAGDKPRTAQHMRQAAAEIKPKPAPPPTLHVIDPEHMAEVKKILSTLDQWDDSARYGRCQEAYSHARQISNLALRDQAFARIDAAVSGTPDAPALEQMAANAAAPTLADLDASLPKDLEKAGYFWQSAQPLVIGHNDGWRGDARTVESALQMAADREKAKAGRLTCPTCGEQILNGIWGELNECGSCYHVAQRAAADPGTQIAALLAQIAPLITQRTTEDQEGLSQAIADLNECIEGTEAAHWIAVGWALLDLVPESEAST